jgi:hypothetical protein
MGEMKNAYKILVGKPERPLERCRRRRDDNNKMDLKEIRCEGMHWIHLASPAFLDKAMNLRVTSQTGNIFTN